MSLLPARPSRPKASRRHRKRRHTRRRLRQHRQYRRHDCLSRPCTTASSTAPRNFELAPKLALRASLRLANGRQGQKNRRSPRSGRLITSAPLQTAPPRHRYRAAVRSHCIFGGLPGHAQTEIGTGFAAANLRFERPGVELSFASIMVRRMTTVYCAGKSRY